MLIIVNTDTSSRAPQRLSARVEATLRYRLACFSKRVAHVEVHISDPAQKRDAGEKRCTIQARPEGLAPIAVAEKALTFEQALAGAAAKTVAALERALAPLGSGRSR
jgi:hypothetical protein